MVTVASNLSFLESSTGTVTVPGNLIVNGAIIGSSVSGTPKSTSTSTPPPNPSIGDIWYYTVTDDIFRYTSDGNTATWLDITGPTIANASTSTTFNGGIVSGGVTFQSVVQHTNATVATSTITGALTVVGGVGIGGNLYVGSNIYSNGSALAKAITTTTTPTSASIGDIWYYPVTDQMFRYTYDGNTTTWIDITGPSLANGSTSTTFTGGIVTNAVTFQGPVTFSGNATYIGSTNTYYTDNLIEVHLPPGGIGSQWASDDGKDVGFRFHYYNRSLSTDSNAALVLADDSQFLEWYATGSENASGDFTGTVTYGTIKTGNILLSNNTGTSVAGFAKVEPFIPHPFMIMGA
jgi:hypothetical protein